jgi:very-short-patch-repair endonuclease
VVELDGDQAHRTPAQRRKDHRNDIVLRSHDLVVVRYDWDLVHNEPKLVFTDLTGRLVKGAGWAIGRAPLVMTTRERPKSPR